MVSAGARAYNGALGEEPPTGSRGRAPEAERLLAFGHPMEATNVPYSLKALESSNVYGNVVPRVLARLHLWSNRSCNYRISVWHLFRQTDG